MCKRYSDHGSSTAIHSDYEKRIDILDLGKLSFLLHWGIGSLYAMLRDWMGPG